MTKSVSPERPSRRPSPISAHTSSRVPTPALSITAPTISSRISLRHGIEEENLKLLAASPPETRLTELAYNPQAKDASGHPTIIDAETGVAVQRHDDLWFDDGSVICRAENTIFCVHMSQLARHSLVFHDMVMLSNPEMSRLDSTMIVQDSKASASRRVPVVYMYDSAEDVGNLLTALYDGPTFGDNDEEDFRAVSGILRLATKYLIDSLRTKALAHLSIAWPSTLKAWDARESKLFDMEETRRYPHPFNIINLARLVNAPSLLPAAFYDLSRYTITQILEPTEDEALYRSPAPPPLSAFDLQRLVLGKESGQITVTTLIQSMGSGQYIRHGQTSAMGHSAHFRKSSGSGACVSAAACRKDFTELVDLATQHYLFDRERGCYDPLYVADELGQLKSAEFSECKACAKSLEAWAAREREKIWKMIPFWFRLDTGGEVSPTGSQSLPHSP